MANVAIICLFLSFLLGVQCAPFTNQNLVDLDQTALSALLIPFREALLHRIAVDWNHTLTDSHRLQADLQVCSGQIKDAVSQCEHCTEAACRSTDTAAQVSHSATFTDYLKFAGNMMNPYNYMKEPLQEIGDKFGDVKDLLGDGSDAFIDSMAALGKSAGGEFSSAFSSIESAFNTFGGTMKDFGNMAIGGMTGVGGKIGDGFSSAGHAMKDLGNSILHGIGDLFGKRQVSTATMDPQIKHCMEQCASCDALLMPDKRQMVTKVCGADVVKFNDTMRTTVATIKSIYTAVADKNHPIMTSLKYDPASANGIMIGRIYVTVNVKGRYVTYQSNVITAQELALEYWTQWTL